MGRAPCCDKENVKRGPWSPEEDAKLKGFIEKYGTGGNWIALPHKAGLKRCGKSCRLRWLNYLRPNIRHGEFTDDEDKIICSLYANIGSRWSIIAGQLPGRTDNDIKNYWNTKLKKKLLAMLPSFQKRPFLPLQSPAPTYYNRSSDLFNYDPNFYNHTTTTTSNLINLNNMINTSIPTTTTTTLVQDLSPPPDSSNSLMMSLITNNNNNNINENRCSYLGFDLQGGHDDQSMYNNTTHAMASFKEAMLVFGSVSEGGTHEVMSTATTGSSSEGAGSQISYGNNYTSKDQHKLLQKQYQYQYHQIKQEDQFSFQQGTQSQISFMNHKYYITDEKPKGGHMMNYEESSTLDVKQLIGTTNSSSSYCLFNDEYKTTHNDDHHKDDMYAIITDL